MYWGWRRKCCLNFWTSSRDHEGRSWPPSVPHANGRDSIRMAGGRVVACPCVFAIPTAPSVVFSTLIALLLSSLEPYAGGDLPVPSIRSEKDHYPAPWDGDRGSWIQIPSSITVLTQGSCPYVCGRLNGALLVRMKDPLSFLFQASMCLLPIVIMVTFKCRRGRYVYFLP